MSFGDQARLPRSAPSTNPDGLDLSVAEARAMSREEFRSVFGLASLEDVPLVAPGFLAHPPRGCEWYVRWRPAPKNPGPKDRKVASYELVVKAPQRAVAQAGGGIVVNPKRIGLDAKEADAARLEALVFLARKSGRRRRATTWPIERIQSLLCVDLLEKYIAVYLPKPPQGVSEDSAPYRTKATYRYKIRAFQKAFPELEVGDVDDWIVEEYGRRANERSRMSRTSDLHTAKRSLNKALTLIGVPPTYKVHFRIPDPGMLPKTAWTPEEYDRLCAAADGWLFNADGTPKLGEDGRQQRRTRSVLCREAWRRAILFLPYTTSRHGRLPLTRWVPPETRPLDGKALKDRPWIEVTDEEIVYHRDGEARSDSNKGCRANKIPTEFEPLVRAWYAADLARGYEFVFHQSDGSRYAGTHLCKETFKSIVRDAGLDESRIPHHLKDLSVEWSDDAGMDRDTLAAHADTTARTLGQKYGDPQRTAKLQKAAEEMTQTAWRKRGQRKAKVAKLFDRGRGGPAPAAASPGRRRRGIKGKIG